MNMSQHCDQPAITVVSPLYRRLFALVVMSATLIVISPTVVAQESGNEEGQVIDPRVELNEGVKLLREGKAKESLKHLDRVVKASPESEPYLWQRGIAQYFAGEYKAGRAQFESHRKVNPNDVENATWHFICVAAIEGVEKAREEMLPAPGDPRVPLPELWDLYKGTGSVEAVEAAVAETPAGSNARRQARFYADLYLGLLAHAEGKRDDAKRYLEAAAELPEQSVMADVARVSRDLLVKKEQSADTKTPDADN